MTLRSPPRLFVLPNAPFTRPAPAGTSSRRAPPPATVSTRALTGSPTRSASRPSKLLSPKSVAQQAAAGRGSYSRCVPQVSLWGEGRGRGRTRTCDTSICVSRAALLIATRKRDKNLVFGCARPATPAASRARARGGEPTSTSTCATSPAGNMSRGDRPRPGLVLTPRTDAGRRYRTPAQRRGRCARPGGNRAGALSSSLCRLSADSPPSAVRAAAPLGRCPVGVHDVPL